MPYLRRLAYNVAVAAARWHQSFLCTRGGHNAAAATRLNTNTQRGKLGRRKKV